MRSYLTVAVMILVACNVNAQQAKSEIREGNRLFKAEKFEDSEISYRKALDAETSSIPGNFNLGGALYRQEKYDEAEDQFSKVSCQNTSREVQSNAYHNLGNTYLQAGKLDEAIESYKEALRRNPDDMETKYNLAYAQQMKKKQEQQKQQQNQNQDQNQDQQNQDKQNQDKQNQDQQNQDQQNQDKQNQQQQNQQQQNQDQQNQQQQSQLKISKSDAERMLNALANDEKATQEKVKKAKALAKRVRTLKDW